MKAGDGALTRGPEPLPRHRMPTVRQPHRHVISEDRHVPDRGLDQHPLPPMNARRGPRARPDLWQEAATRRTASHQPPSGWVSRRARDRCPNGRRRPGRLQSGRPEPGPGSAGMCQSLILQSHADHLSEIQLRHASPKHLIAQALVAQAALQELWFRRCAMWALPAPRMCCRSLPEASRTTTRRPSLNVQPNRPPGCAPPCCRLPISGRTTTLDKQAVCAKET